MKLVFPKKVALYSTTSNLVLPCSWSSSQANSRVLYFGLVHSKKTFLCYKSTAKLPSQPWLAHFEPIILMSFRCFGAIGTNYATLHHFLSWLKISPSELLHNPFGLGPHKLCKPSLPQASKAFGYPTQKPFFLTYWLG